MKPLFLTTTLGLAPSRRTQLLLALTAAIILLSRLLTLNPNLVLPGDAAFALGLRHYDLAAGTPPFPGFPVYMALARVFAFFGAGDAAALALPGICSCALSVFPLHSLVKRLHGGSDAALAVGLFAVNPGIWILSLRPGYFSLLLFPFLFALRLIVRIVLLPPGLHHKTRFISHYTGTAMLGLLIGIHPETAVLVLPMLVVTGYGLYKLRRGKIVLETLNGVFAGVCLWAIPFLFAVPLQDLLFPQTAAGTAPEAALLWTLPLRLKALGWNLFGFGFLGPGPLALILPAGLLTALALFTAIRGMRLDFKYFFLLIFFLFYGLYVLLFSPQDEPGHIILFLPLLIIFMAAGLATLPRQPFLIVGSLLMVSTFLFGASRAAAYRNTTPPLAALARDLPRLGSPETIILVCGASHRFLDGLRPEYRTLEIRSAKDLSKPMIRKALSGRTVFALSEVPGIEQIPGNPVVVSAAPANPYLYGLRDTLRVVRIGPEYRP